MNKIYQTIMITGALALSSASTIAQRGDKIVAGESVLVGGATLSTWARVNGNGQVIWVGLTVPLSLVETPPTGGPGPVAVLNFPRIVQETTYFNHFELNAEPQGHPTNPTYRTPDRYSAPHFDFHFYAIAPEEVAAIPFANFPLPDAPAELLPRHYAQPEISIPQMGRHAAPLSEFVAVGPLDVTMIAGFLPDASMMHFIEPMAGYQFLLERKSFSLKVPQPKTLGWSTRYPSECLGLYDAKTDSYQFVFRGFKQAK